MLEVGELPDGVRVRPASPLDPIDVGLEEGASAGLGLLASVTRLGAVSIEGLSVVAGEMRIELPAIPVEIVLDVPDGHRPAVSDYLEPVAVPFPPADIRPFVGGLLLLFIGLLVYILRTSRVVEPITTPPSPDRVATEALARLRGRVPRTPEDIPPFVDEVSEVLRVYIERRFAVHAPEQTSEEFIGAVRSHPALTGRCERLEPFVVLCDLVKFARHTPGFDQVNNLLVTAETFVEDTRGDAPSDLMLEVATGEVERSAAARAVDWRRAGGPSMILGDPMFLLLLLPLALFMALTIYRHRQSSIDGASDRVLAGVPRTLRARTRWLPGTLLALAAVLLVVALARPLRGREESRVYTEGIDIMLVVDTSSSMTNDGIEQGVTNLDVVKDVVAEFVGERRSDRLGLLSFAAYPRTECPLTLDTDAVIDRLRDVEVVHAQTEEDGTAIGVALGYAAAKLRDSDAASKVVVLLTDGEENQWTVDPLEAAALCKDLGITVYTVGAGRVYQVDPLFGGKHERQLDTDLLQAMASNTGGRFFRAKDGSALRDVYAEIDELEKTERQDVRYTDYEDLYWWLVAPAVALLALELLLARGPYLEFAS